MGGFFLALFICFTINSKHKYRLFDKYKYQKRTHASKVQKKADQEKENKENPFLGWDVAIKLNID